MAAMTATKSELITTNHKGDKSGDTSADQTKL